MIYFYGGAFNPMTLAHLQIIFDVKKNMNDEDWLTIGITQHDYKVFDLDYNVRSMIVHSNLNYYCYPFKHIRLVKQNKRTWAFLHEIFDEQTQKDITIIVGEDEWNDLNNGKWHYSKELLNTYKFKVIPRTNDISATKVRELIKNNANYDELKKYITKKTYDMLKNYGKINN